MTKASKRIDEKDLTKGTSLAVPTDHVDAIHLDPNKYIALVGGKVDYTKYSIPNPYSRSGTADPGNGEVPPPEGMGDDNTLPPDIPSLSAIESVVYEQYYDETTKGQKVRAIIKIRNTAQVPTNIMGIDARIYNPATSKAPIASSASAGSTSSTKVAFITPSPTIPNVVFKRDSSTISWGWNNSTGLGSYKTVTYEWIISATSSPTASALNSGTETYNASSNLQIGSSSNYRTYRVSSRDKDTAATLSFRWLRVRAKVVGTNNQTYYSSYSAPI